MKVEGSCIFTFLVNVESPKYTTTQNGIVLRPTIFYVCVCVWACVWREICFGKTFIDFLSHEGFFHHTN